MPKAARNRVVPLTVTKKKDRQTTNQINEVRSLLDKFQNVFLFTFDNLSTEKMQKVREDWKGSRFFFGKNKIVSVAFGRSPSEEYKNGLSEFGNLLTGHKALFFTNHSKNEVLKYFDAFESPGFAKTGFVATDTIVLEAGPLKQFPFSMEKRLRELGLDVTLKKGVIELLQEHIVCTEGQALTSEAARILELMDVQMAHFKLKVEGVWNEQKGYVDLSKPTSEEMQKPDEDVPKSRSRRKNNTDKIVADLKQTKESIEDVPKSRSRRKKNAKTVAVQKQTEESMEEN